MKFGKLTLILAIGIVPFSGITHAEVELNINKDILKKQKQEGKKEPLLSIKLGKNKGFCYTSQEQNRFLAKESGAQICLENEIAIDSTGPEDYFNFDAWYEPGKFFNKVETMEWQEISRQDMQFNRNKPYTRSCKAIVKGFTRREAAQAVIEFDDSCGIKILNPEADEYLETVSFILNNQTGMWEYASFTPKNGESQLFGKMTAFPQRKAQWVKDYQDKIPEDAKSMLKTLNSGK